MYASLDDVRNEGVTATMAGDGRVLALIAEASTQIDRVTGWYFEPRLAIYVLDGRGVASLEPPVPPIRLDAVVIDDRAIRPSELSIVGAPVDVGFTAPRLSLRHRRFPRGRDNVVATGLWGYTEPDGTPEGRTPLEIRRACLLLVMRSLDPLADTAASDARNAWRIIEERTREQLIRFANPATGDILTGDPDVDAILARYCRPIGMGAA